MSDKIFYVYQYVTENNVPYYIGKGSKSRIREKHHHTVVPLPKYRQYVKIGLNEVEACELENQLIRQYGRKIDGGLLDNIKLNRWACTSGWNHSAESKQKISNKNSGKIRSNEAKQNYSKPKSSEHIEKIRLANIGRPYDDRYNKISATKSRQKWYTNGIATKMCEPGQEPDGFVPGQKIGF